MFPDLREGGQQGPRIEYLAFFLAFAKYRSVLGPYIEQAGTPLREHDPKTHTICSMTLRFYRPVKLIPDVNLNSLLVRGAGLDG